MLFFFLFCYKVWKFVTFCVQGFLRAAMRAVNEDGVRLIGYTAWSLMDNLEWLSGYR